MPRRTSPHSLWLKANRPHEFKRLRANQTVVAAVKSGKLVKPSACSQCGIAHPPREIHGHHDDYDKPLDVRWLCRACHNAYHREARRVSEAARRARLRDPAYRLDRRAS